MEDKPPGLAEHDPLWARRFEDLASLLRACLSGLTATIDHVGSTSVNGLAAKPIIDIDVVVESVAIVPAALTRLEAIGYQPEGALGVPGREALQAPPDTPAHHVYVVVRGSRPHLDHVLLRDLLRRRRDLAVRYEAVKRASTNRLPADRAGYTDAKLEVIAELLAIARREAGLPEDPTAIELDGVLYRWRFPLADEDVEKLHASAFEEASSGSFLWGRQRPKSLGWVSATVDDDLVGFANVAWNGTVHAFLLDMAVAPQHRRRGIGRRLLERCVSESTAAGCVWLHVDYEPGLVEFYRRCGFESTTAGLRRLGR